MDRDDSIGEALAAPDDEGREDVEEVRAGTYLPADTSCDNCGHQPTCAFYANAVDMVAAHAQRTEEKPPIDPADLAAACDAYDPE